MMPFIGYVERFQSRNGKSTKRVRLICAYTCDTCGKEYERRGGYQQTQASSLGFTYCSSKCFGVGSRKGSKHDIALRINYAKKHEGIEHPASRPDVIAKRRETCIEKYSGPSPASDPTVVASIVRTRINLPEQIKQDIRSRTVATLEQRYGVGVTNPMQIPGVIAKVSASNKVSSAEAAEKRKCTNLARMGVAWPMQSELVKQKSIDTCMKKYGVASTWQSPELRAKVEQSNLKKWGVKNPMQDPNIFSKAQRARRHATMIKHWKTCEDLTCVASYEVAVVNWMNDHRYNFEWQLPFTMPDGRRYFVDMYVVDGPFADTWIEVKGYYDSLSREKCEWFQSEHENFELWNKKRLIELGILWYRTNMSTAPEVTV